MYYRNLWQNRPTADADQRTPQPEAIGCGVSKRAPNDALVQPNSDAFFRQKLLERNAAEKLAAEREERHLRRESKRAAAPLPTNNDLNAMVSQRISEAFATRAPDRHLNGEPLNYDE